MPRLLHHILDEAALRDPQALALRCGGDSLTYGDLSRQSYGLARVLLEQGLERRDRVAVLIAKGPKVPAAFYGVMAAGGILVPIDPKSPAEQVARILQATGARFVVTEPGRQAVLEGALSSCPDVEHLIGLEPADGEEGAAVSVTPWAAVEEAATSRPPAVEVIDTDPVYVLHTSGSTGLPKLIQHTHRSALSFVEWAVAEYALRPEDRLTNHSSHHTCFATFDYYAAARAGAATVVLTPAMMMLPSSLSALLEREKVSVWYSVPTALVHLSLRGDLESRDLSALRWVLFAGETFPEKHLRRLAGQLPGARFSHVYGSTEVNVCTYYHLPEEGLDPSKPLPLGQLPIGKVCSNSRTVVVDGNLEAVPDGEIGELLVRGSTVMSGYWGEPERNRQILVRRPADGGLEEVYFRTGDRVRRLPDGNLTFVARADLQVKVRGFRVELEEVEAALLSLEGIEAAAAFAVADGEGSSALRAAVVPEASSDGSPKTTLEPRALQEGLKALLPVYAIPEKIQVLGSLPRTPTGKVDRKALVAAEAEAGNSESETAEGAGKP